MKIISLIGSTGSIGTQTLNVVRRNKDKFKIVALMANNSLDLLEAQVKEFKPLYVGIFNIKLRQDAEKRFKNVKLFFGEEALIELAKITEANLIVVSIVGMLGLKAVMSALENKKNIALANKEALVAGGSLVMNLAKLNNVDILPIDSEHSAVFQCLNCGKADEVDSIILTASGGPFLNYSRQRLENITPEMAIKHPNWKMGRKISVDSATMMNKALEIIEARWLFSTNKIEYIIHPESVIHSMVRFIDGSTIAQLSQPNMEIPIQIALGYPDRLPLSQFNFSFDKNLTFIKPNEKDFPLPSLAFRALNKGGNSPCIMNAANEAAVELFLEGKISFLDIFSIVENSFDSNFFVNNPTIDDIYLTHENVYDYVFNKYSK